MILRSTETRYPSTDPGPGFPLWPVLCPGVVLIDSGPDETEDGPGDDGETNLGSTPEPNAERLRVVIVEDEAIIAIDLEDMLSAMGVEVVGTAYTAEDAIKLAESKRPDCMTVDIRLQGDRDGVSAAREIFERFGIRSVFITAYSDPDTVARAQDANPLGWINKPLRRDAIEDVLRDMLRKSGKE